MIDWINFIALIISIILFCFFYTVSVQPVKKVRKKGDRAWKECMILRSLAGVFELIIILNCVLWIFFPIPILDWKIHSNWLIGIITGITISIPCVIIMYKGIKDAGSETLRPSKETEIYGGIYKYIRHPQTLGEFPLFIAVAFLVNSWFLVILMTIFIIGYIPIMIYYEEKDLILRFGDKYREYRKTTGALFPKFRK